MPSVGSGVAAPGSKPAPLDLTSNEWKSRRLQLSPARPVPRIPGPRRRREFGATREDCLDLRSGGDAGRGGRGRSEDFYFFLRRRLLMASALGTLSLFLLAGQTFQLTAGGKVEFSICLEVTKTC